MHSSLQDLNTLTKESADDKQVEEDPETIRYSDRAPCEDMYSHCTHTVPITYGTLFCCHTHVICHDYSSIEDNYALLLFQIATYACADQNKHMYVNRPDLGRSVFINASLVDVSHKLYTYMISHHTEDYRYTYTRCYA